MTSSAKRILQWEAKVERGQQEFDSISRVIKKEVERFEEERVSELRSTIIRYIEEHMKHQGQVSQYQIYTNLISIKTFKLMFHIS